MNASFFEGYRPGILGAMIRAHMDYYAPHWGFGTAFETKLATEAGAFMDRFDPSRDLIASEWQAGQMSGCVFVDGSQVDGAGLHLRWFIVDDGARGSGLGRRLMDRAMAHCDASGLDLCWLTTFAGLDAARKLYQQAGFVLVSESGDDQWQGGVREQMWQRYRTQQDL